MRKRSYSSVVVLLCNEKGNIVHREILSSKLVKLLCRVEKRERSTEVVKIICRFNEGDNRCYNRLLFVATTHNTIPGVVVEECYRKE